MAQVFQMKIVYTIFVVILLILAGAIAAVSLANPVDDKALPSDALQIPIAYHFVMIAKESNDSFLQGVQDGALRAARELNAAVETQSLWLADKNAQVDRIAAMIAARVDGIAVQVEDEPEYVRLLDEARENGIPVVAFESDVQSYSVPVIGSGSFQIGSEAGKLAIEASGGSARIAVIINGRMGQDESSAANLLILGLMDAFAGYPDMRIETRQLTNGLMFGAAEVTNTILREFPDVNMIIATNDKDTLSVVDVVVDANRLSGMTIIGYGTPPETMKFIETEVVYGTVASSPEEIGYNSIKALAELRDSSFTSSYLSTNVYSYTARNIGEYMRAQEDARNAQE